MDNNWPSARMVNVIDNEIRILNDTQNPIYIPKHEHLCQVRATYVVDPPKISSASDFKPKITKPSPPYSKTIIIGTQLSPEWCKKNSRPPYEV